MLILGVFRCGESGYSIQAIALPSSGSGLFATITYANLKTRKLKRIDNLHNPIVSVIREFAETQKQLSKFPFHNIINHKYNPVKHNMLLVPIFVI